MRVDLQKIPAESHIRWMYRAIEVAQQCRDIEWYGVGCVIVRGENELTSGFTGERWEESSKQHAEATALAKLSPEDFGSLVLYTTLEPCSVRASGKPPCVDRIVQAGITAVVYGAKEPYNPKLGIRCEGHERLRTSGVQVLQLQELAELCLESALQSTRK